ncbi:MAG: hypothetical protein J1G02_05160 [Clostridiales bacterium]|nr:hypothetical protein [Clostridiales bacterium]
MSKKDNNEIKKNQPVWKRTSRFLKLFFKKPQIVSLSGALPNKAIYVANHAAMFGPVMYNLYLPATVAPWGAYPMTENYKSRYNYLRNVYFIQKRHKSKFAATILASFEAALSIYFYRGLRVIPSYNDNRFIKTIRQSIEMIKNNIGVLIFPEDSDKGYHEVLTEFHAGFVELAKYYWHKFRDNLPIYPVYYHAKKRKIVIGNPSKITDYLDKGMSRQEIAADFCRQVNNLFLHHIKD